MLNGTTTFSHVKPSDAGWRSDVRDFFLYKDLVSNGPLLSSDADFFLAASQTKEEPCRCTCMNVPERERNRFR